MDRPEPDGCINCGSTNIERKPYQIGRVYYVDYSCLDCGYLDLDKVGGV